MTRSKPDHGHPNDDRTRITRAAITGLVAGATRAVLDTLLRYLTAGC
ncbi:hypothetical protein [Micromonospora wenchangensis]|nr:hypothetical protein [Micromonospora wenchangensis]